MLAKCGRLWQRGELDIGLNIDITASAETGAPLFTVSPETYLAFAIQLKVSLAL